MDMWTVLLLSWLLVVAFTLIFLNGAQRVTGPDLPFKPKASPDSDEWPRRAA
jgi:hypothetical protein